LVFLRSQVTFPRRHLSRRLRRVSPSSFLFFSRLPNRSLTLPPVGCTSSVPSSSTLLGTPPGNFFRMIETILLSFFFLDLKRSQGPHLLPLRFSRSERFPKPIHLARRWVIVFARVFLKLWPPSPFFQVSRRPFFFSPPSPLLPSFVESPEERSTTFISFFSAQRLPFSRTSMAFPYFFLFEARPLRSIADPSFFL